MWDLSDVTNDESSMGDAEDGDDDVDDDEDDDD